jgi:hypothetical protein
VHGDNPSYKSHGDIENDSSEIEISNKDASENKSQIDFFAQNF